MPRSLGAIAVACLCVATVAPATYATSRDFLDETLVSHSFKAHEVGLEMGLESRLDADYRLQGWYATEVEIGVTSRALIEMVGLYATRGQGLELGGWRTGARYRLLSAPRFPVDVTAAVEYEVETAVAKHPGTERILVPRVALSRTWREFTGTVNLGAQSRLSPSPRSRFLYGAGLRYPENSDLKAGVEFSHEPIEGSTRITPQIWIDFPGETRLRLGGVFGVDPRPYWLVARAIVETEF